MTVQGKELLSFVQEIRRFCTQLADLLGTADKLMAVDGWEIATSSNVAYASPSASIDKPDKWFPHEVFRFYRSEDNPRVLAVVSLLIDDDRKGEYTIDEPLLSVGWFEFQEHAPESLKSDLWWWSRFHGYMKDRRDDGSINSVCPKRDWPTEYRVEWYPFDRASTFAVALADIADTKNLEERMIKPLLVALRESRVASHP